MQTRTTTKYVRNLTKDEYDQCLKLNMGDDGMMYERLVNSYFAKDDAKVILIKAAAEIIAWSFIFDDRKGKNKGAYFYVHPDHRRRGLGKRLVKHSTKIANKPNVFSWDDASEQFFEKHKAELNVKTYRSDTWW